MYRHVVILPGDKRQKALGEMLDGKLVCCTWEEYENITEKLCKQYKEENGETIFVLPTSVVKMDANSERKEKLKLELIKKKNSSGLLWVYGGVFSPEWVEFLSKEESPFWDFMKLPEVVEGNGWITAEATVAEVLRLGPRSIWQQNVLVTGYGCCGEKIAKVFSWLGANVTIAARREEVRKKANRDGFMTIDISQIEEAVCDMDTIINTVPAMLITGSVIKRMGKDALILDIASAPGGTDFEKARECGITAKLALGLPGIYTTKSSALLLKKAIERHTPLKETVRKEKLWIFQIAI